MLKCCTFKRDFTNVHGIMCSALIMLGSGYSLHYKDNLGLVFCQLFHYSHLICADLPKFYARLATCIRFSNLWVIPQIGDSLKFFLPIYYYADLLKFYATNIQCYMVDNSIKYCDWASKNQ